jgi:hypothetical protein
VNFDIDNLASREERAIKLRVLALGLVAALLLPGCFVIVGFRFSRFNVPKGGKAIARLWLRPAIPEGVRGNFFILVHYFTEVMEPPLLRVARPKVFDKKGNFGGPFRLVGDNDLEDFVRDSELCAEGFAGGFAQDDVDSHWVLLRTKKRVRTRGKIEKTALTEIGLRDRPGGGDAASIVHLYSGLWRDDDTTEGPSLDDTTLCLSSVETSISIGKGISETMQARQLRLPAAIRSLFK